MKKIFLTLALVISLTTSVLAQYKPFQFGLKVEPGIGWTKLNSDNLSKKSNDFSFNWGFVGNFYFVENYGFSTGFNIKYIDASYLYNNDNQDIIECNIKNQYLEIPLSLMMRTERIGDLRITGNIGYGLGIKLNGSDKHIDNQGNELMIDNEFNSLRHALIVKLGVEYYVYKSSCITASLVFNNNFVNIYKKNNALNQDVMLNNIGIEIGFLF